MCSAVSGRRQPLGTLPGREGSPHSGLQAQGQGQRHRDDKTPTLKREDTRTTRPASHGAQGSATLPKWKGGSTGATTAQRPLTSPPRHHAVGPCKGGPSPLPHHAHLSPHHTPPPCPPAVRTGPAGRGETRRSCGAAAGPQEWTQPGSWRACAFTPPWASITHREHGLCAGTTLSSSKTTNTTPSTHVSKQTHGD